MWRDSTRLFDMLDSARLVMEYVAGLTADDFKQRVGVQDKVLWRLMIIGEAAKNVSEGYRLAHPEIEWQGIAGLGDILVHQYFRLDFDEVWTVIQNRIPELIAALELLILAEEE